ncbi:MAG TPA: branched-chain amino acid ABC transporter permease [Nitrososphaerales archaeon]|nr:branched-chain amino acid ABC transporter permease [Nitrososphaerales archaeon]
MPLTLDFLEQITANAVLLGFAYGMVGLGLSLVLGIMNVLNISHGTMYVLGGFLTFYVVSQLHYPPLVGFAFAAGITFVLGFVLQVGLISRVSNDPARVMLLTFGVAIILGQISLLIWGGTAIPTPSIVKGYIVIGGVVDFQTELLLAALVGIAVAIGTTIFLRSTKLGKAMRMVSQNSEAALSLGVNSKWIFAVALGIGSLYSGLAGSLLSPITFVYPDYQWFPLIYAFVVVIVGGLGSVIGSVVGGLIFGILETVGQVIFPSSSDVLVFLLIIVIILLRPRGLFGAKDRV